MPLILASTSPYRKALLERLRVPFDAIAPDVDEGPIQSSGLPPIEVAGRLAEAKARALADTHPDAVILGGDQVVSLDSQLLGKPGTAEAAVDQLTRMAGRTHELITAIAVLHRGEIHPHTDVARLTMRPLSISELRRYVEADLPLDCAGSYKLESLGIALFERIESADQTAITGLPLIALTTILRHLGIAIP